MTEATELPSLRFRLPGTWAQIPLHDAEVARAAVRRLVARQVGTTDEAATARAHLRRQFTAALAEAIEGEAQSMQIALEIIEELPIPASFTVFLPRQGLTPAIGTGAEATSQILEQGLRGRADVDESTIERFEIAESQVIRTQRNQFVEVAADAEPMKVLVVDYWLTIPGSKRFVLLNFHTALADAASEMIVLFDAIVRASYWWRPTDVAENAESIATR